MEKITFKSGKNTLVGNLYFPDKYDPAEKYPTVLCTGSWTTVKEQMAGLYAQKLSKLGYICLAFDSSGFGESEGEPRFFEDPEQKIKDIHHAINYLVSRKDVAPSAVAALGICAGAMYTLMAAVEDTNIKAVATVASWLHDTQAVKLFYGGDEGVQERILAAQKAKQHYLDTKEVLYVPTISKTDPSAAMFGDYDYYLNPNRGAVTNWSADKFAVMSWEKWLTLDPMPSAAKLFSPIVMVHSDGCVLPHYTKHYFDKIPAKDKLLHWVETDLPSPLHQFMFYDQENEVNLAINQVHHWFEKHLVLN